MVIPNVFETSRPTVQGAINTAQGYGAKTYATTYAGNSNGAIVAEIGSSSTTICDYSPDGIRYGSATDISSYTSSNQGTWQKSGNKWYFYDNSGNKVTGWIKRTQYSDYTSHTMNWYYLDASGAMVTGWAEISGSWYYFYPSDDSRTGSPEGSMARGWNEITYEGNKYWFYFVEESTSDEGKMLTGRRALWYNGEGSYYYLCESANSVSGYVTGAMVRSTTYGGHSYNSSGEGESISIVDRTTPAVSVSYSTTSATNGNVTATITTDESVQAVSGWTLASNQKSMTKTYSQNASETVTVKDLAGNEASASVSISNIDKTAPTLSVSYSPISATTGTVTATISANEKVQAVSGWTLASNQKSMTKTYSKNASGTVTVKDLVGNSSKISVSISNIDKTAPNLSIKYSTTSATNGAVTATITADEQMQAVSGWTLASNKKTMTKKYTANTTETITVKDLAGNSKSIKVSINNIDKTAPTLKATYSTTAATNGSVTATITANEQVQAVSGWTLSSDKKVLTKTYTANKTETVTVKDLVGNSRSVSISISNIDKTAPTLKATYSTTAATNGNVTATITANEQVQAVSGWTLSSDKKVLTKTYTANKTETVTVKDLVGNSRSVSISISNIDKAAPILNVSYSTTAKTTEAVTATISANEQMQAVSGWTLASDKKSMTKKYSQNGTETVTVKDLAGNAKSIKVSVQNISKEVTPTPTPTITPTPTVTPTPTPTTTTPIGTLKGDANKDNKITVTDLLILKKNIVKLIELSSESLDILDMNSDGKITVTDLLLLKKKILKLY